MSAPSAGCAALQVGLGSMTRAASPCKYHTPCVKAHTKTTYRNMEKTQQTKTQRGQHTETLWKFSRQKHRDGNIQKHWESSADRNTEMATYWIIVKVQQTATYRNTVKARQTEIQRWQHTEIWNKLSKTQENADKAQSKKHPQRETLRLWERERERERHRQTEIERDRDRHTERQTDRQRQRDIDRERHRERTEMETDSTASRQVTHLMLQQVSPRGCRSSSSAICSRQYRQCIRPKWLVLSASPCWGETQRKIRKTWLPDVN